MIKISVILLIYIVLSADIKVIVSKNNKINNVTKNELSNIYLKKADKIKGHKVTVLNNKDNYDEFNKKVLNKTPNQIHAYWMKQIFLGKKIPPKNITSKDVSKEIKKDKSVITYSSQELNEKVIYEIK